jgi:hypothetical protein
MTNENSDFAREPGKLKRAAKQLRNSCRLLVEKLYSAIAREESRIARMELGMQSRSTDIGASCKDKE